MSRAHVDAVARALLYEGYILYPYRASAVKNRHRWTFGTLFPRAYADTPGSCEAWSMQTQCLVRGDARTVLQTAVRFLHLVERVEDGGGWQEAVEREVAAPERTLGELLAGPDEAPFALPGDRSVDGGTTRVQQAVRGTVRRSAEPAGDGAVRLTVRLANVTPVALDDAAGGDRRARALAAAFASTHTVLGVRGGHFVSLIDPPAELREAALGCQNVGTWPVLVGEPGARDTMLSSPIILEDYPRVAPESAGDHFDATEIDEMLTLRILTLTEDERRQMREVDPHARRLLERTEALSEDQRRRLLHGAVRTPAAGLRPGSRVRLRPQGRADVFDLALAGRTATLVAVEEDLEGRLYLAVTVDDDPGRDLGAAGKVAHRFFFRPEEVEPLS